MQVEVDDDDYDDDVDYADDEITSRPSERREAERAIREQEEESLRRLQRPSARDKLANMTEEEMGRYFEARHAQESSYSAANVDSHSADVYDDISQNTLLPTTRDPTLWMIKVRQGEERNITLHLLRKCIASANAGTPLGVASIVCKDNLKGILYVEASKQANVSSLIENVAAINQYDIKVRLFLIFALSI